MAVLAPLSTPGETLHAARTIDGLRGGRRRSRAVGYTYDPKEQRAFARARYWDRLGGWLARIEHARFLTGAAIPVDGGADAALQ